jgi:excisionase family DNA binding protein
MRNKHERTDISLISQSPSVIGQLDRNTGGEDRLLTVVEAARFLNLSAGGLYHLISQRRIPVVRISSRCVRFSRRALLEWVESLSQPADREEV